MITIHGWNAPDAGCSASVLTIGNFDGVHRGHRRLLACAADLARPLDLPLIVVTFEPHPLAVLRPAAAPAPLTTLDQKREHLAELGIDRTVVVRTVPALLGLEPREFVREIVDRFHPRHIVEGQSFGFGRNRAGSPELLTALGPEFGFQTCILDPVRITLDRESIVVSSSIIRERIAAGRMRHAAVCLDRPYALRGRVESGDHRGTTLGFPTANVAGIVQWIPPDGVYAGSLFVDGIDAPAAISIGANPTFQGDRRKIEAHVLDFTGDLHGKYVELRFLDWLRSQRRFPTADDLARQIAADVRAVRNASAASPSTVPSAEI